MSTKLLNASSAIEIRFTPAACQHIKNRLMKEQGIACRLSIEKTGCSGYAYQLSVLTALDMQDHLREACILLPRQADIEFDVFIDKVWSNWLDKLTIDYATVPSVLGRKLVFVHPNETGRCGCGESFHREEKAKDD